VRLPVLNVPVFAVCVMGYNHIVGVVFYEVHDMFFIEAACLPCVRSPCAVLRIPVVQHVRLETKCFGAEFKFGTTHLIGAVGETDDCDVVIKKVVESEKRLIIGMGYEH